MELQFKGTWAYVQAPQARHKACQPTNGSSGLVGGDACSAWAREMPLDNVGGTTGQTTAGVTDITGRTDRGT